MQRSREFKMHERMQTFDNLRNSAKIRRMSPFRMGANVQKGQMSQFSVPCELIKPVITNLRCRQQGVCDPLILDTCYAR